MRGDISGSRVTPTRPRVRAGTRAGMMWFYAGLSLISLIYLMVTLFTPLGPNANTYGLLPETIKLLRFTIAAPVIVIWFIALYGSIRFKSYAERIVYSNDGLALDRVALGLLALVFSLAITTTIQAFEPLMLQHGHGASWTVFANYVGVLGPLVAFLLILSGATRLSVLIRSRGVRQSIYWVSGIMIPLVAIYLTLLFQNPYRSATPNPDQIHSYYLSDPMILLTLSLPHIVTWVIGSLAVSHLYSYYRYADGVLYRRALSRLALGLAAVIGASIVIQLFGAVSPSLARMGLHQVLILVYVLIAIYALGHIWIVLGAKRLTRIEEVT